MMKNYLFLVLSLILTTSAIAQSNKVNVKAILSPFPRVNLDSGAVEDIIIRVQNLGPNDLLNDDTLDIEVKITSTDTIELYPLKVRTNKYFSVGTENDYTLISNYQFKFENEYSICVYLYGTADFPSNGIKNPYQCVSFIVGEEELQKDIRIQNVYFKDNQVYFTSNSKRLTELQIFDITGKLLKTKQLTLSAENQLAFTPPAKGFYFFRIKNQGQVSTAKFIVN